MNTKEILLAARELLAKGWTQGEVSRDEFGNYASPKSKKSCKWCGFGALCAVTDYKQATDILRKVDDINRINFVVFNDLETTTQQDVLNIFDKTILAL